MSTCLDKPRQKLESLLDCDWRCSVQYVHRIRLYYRQFIALRYVLLQNRRKPRKYTPADNLLFKLSLRLDVRSFYPNERPTEVVDWNRGRDCLSILFDCDLFKIFLDVLGLLLLCIWGSDRIHLYDIVPSHLALVSIKERSCFWN